MRYRYAATRAATNHTYFWPLPAGTTPADGRFSGGWLAARIKDLGHGPWDGGGWDVLVETKADGATGWVPDLKLTVALVAAMPSTTPQEVA